MCLLVCKGGKHFPWGLVGLVFGWCGEGLAFTFGLGCALSFLFKLIAGRFRSFTALRIGNRTALRMAHWFGQDHANRILI